jgi:hypothetical protein
MKKMNYFLASASLLLFLFLGVQGLQAQTSIAPSPVNVKSYTQALQGVNLVAEDAAINVLTNEAKNLYQNMPNFTTASGEVEAVTKIEYYQYLVERLNQGELLGELLPQSAGEISTILSRHDQNTGVTTMGVYQDTVELLQQ